MNEGAYFGEEEIISGCRRQYSITCKTAKGTVLVLPKYVFEHEIISDK